MSIYIKETKIYSVKFSIELIEFGNDKQEIAICNMYNRGSVCHRCCSNCRVC